jgi:hypothetical protein
MNQNEAETASHLAALNLSDEINDGSKGKQKEVAATDVNESTGGTETNEYRWSKTSQWLLRREHEKNLARRERSLAARNQILMFAGKSLYSYLIDSSFGKVALGVFDVFQ